MMIVTEVGEVVQEILRLREKYSNIERISVEREIMGKYALSIELSIVDCN